MGNPRQTTLKVRHGQRVSKDMIRIPLYFSSFPDTSRPKKVCTQNVRQKTIPYCKHCRPQT